MARSISDAAAPGNGSHYSEPGRVENHKENLTIALQTIEKLRIASTPQLISIRFTERYYPKLDLGQAKNQGRPR
jgi:hypothetical protein